MTDNLRAALEPLLAAIEREFGEPYPIPEADMDVEEFLAWQAGKVRAALASPSPEPLDEAWKAAEAALPKGWVLDGLRRLYLDGQETTGWDARAVQTGEGHDARAWTVPKIVGSAASPAAALRALAARLSENS